MSQYKRSPFDVPHENECRDCHGRGHTFQTAQRMEIIDRKYVTTELGYGCITCAGIGRGKHLAIAGR